MDLLFITRKWNGYGGMQQLSKDLWRCMRETYKENATLCVLPRVDGLVPLICFWRYSHIHLGDAVLTPLGWLLKKCGVSYVSLTACGLDVVWDRSWYQWMIRSMLPAMDRVVCISRATAKEVQKRGVAQDKITVIPCGVWPEICHAEEPRVSPFETSIASQSPPQDDTRGVSKYGIFPILLSVGRLIPRKGHAWFIKEVFPLLKKEYPNITYVIVGDGPEYTKIISLIEEGGYEDSIIMRRRIDEEEREHIYKDADLCIMPNVLISGDMEGFGIACIEASVRGIPVIAARLEGLQDAVIEGETGIFFESRNREECIAVIQKMLDKNPSLLMGESRREGIQKAMLEHYSWPMLFKRYKEDVFTLSQRDGIGVVSWDYDPPKGGLGYAMQEIVHCLKEDGKSVEVHTSRFMFALSRVLYIFTLFFSLQRWIDKNRIGTLMLPTGPGGVFLYKKPKRCTTIIICYHSYDQQSRLVPGEKWKKVFAPLEKRTLKFADQVLCYSEDTKKVLEEQYTLSNVKLLPQILNLERWITRTRTRIPNTCLFIGRPDRRKGYDVLQQAWPSVKKEYSDAELHCITKGDMPQDELIAHVQSADLVIVPSYLEGFGLVVAQAQAAGTAVIASDCDGLRSLIRHKETGWLVPSGDVTGLAQGISHILKNRSLREEIAIRAKENVLNRFNKENAVESLKYAIFS
jgi:glycosyltransferase involved in cell wall biosynthesis